MSTFSIMFEGKRFYLRKLKLSCCLNWIQAMYCWFWDLTFTWHSVVSDQFKETCSCSYTVWSTFFWNTGIYTMSFSIKDLQCFFKERNKQNDLLLLLLSLWNKNKKYGIVVRLRDQLDFTTMAMRRKWVSGPASLLKLI